MTDTYGNMLNSGRRKSLSGEVFTNGAINEVK